MPSLYDVSIPVFTNVAQTELAILKKGAEHAKANNISDETILNARLYEDMLPLSRQVVIIAGTAAKAIERLTGTAPPELPNKGETLEELYALMAYTLKALASVDKESVQAAEGKEIPCQFGPRSLKTNALDYVQGYTIPNLYFHLNITYALLRQLGVPLQKADYLAEFIHSFTQVP